MFAAFLAAADKKAWRSNKGAGRQILLSFLYTFDSLKITEIDFISGCIFLKRIIINLIIYYLIVSTFTCCQLKKISPSASSLSKSGCWFGFWFLTMINMLLRPNYYLITKCRTAPISECCAPSTRSLPWSKYYINIYISWYIIYISHTPWSRVPRLAGSSGSPHMLQCPGCTAGYVGRETSCSSVGVYILLYICWYDIMCLCLPRSCNST